MQVYTYVTVSDVYIIKQQLPNTPSKFFLYKPFRLPPLQLMISISFIANH